MKLEEKLIWGIYTEMYEKATPPADFKKLVEKYKNTKVQFFNDYYLSMDEQTEIINRHLKGSKLTPKRKRDVEISVFLGVSPNSVRNNN